MSIPYTREAIAQLRMAARNSTPHDAVVAQFGWSPGMLERVCRNHCIAIAPPVVANPVTRPPVVEIPPAERLTKFIAHLSPRQQEVMAILRAAFDMGSGYVPATIISGSVTGHSCTRAVGRIVQCLSIKLKADRVPYSIDVGRDDRLYLYRLKLNGEKS